jgi:hypothetical protein
MLKKEEIEHFLNDFKQKMNFWNLIMHSNRLDKKNALTMLELELNIEKLKKILNDLKVSDYSEGPKPDTLYKGKDLWVFGKEIKNREVYIKITVGEPANPVICISFHFSEYAMKYPYKN